MIARIAAAWLLAATLAGCAAGNPARCRIDRVVDLPLLPGGHLPAMEARLGGQKVVVYIDTGASMSLITGNAADRFGLRGGPESGMVRMNGVNGTLYAPLGRVPHLVLGHGIARDLELPIAGDLGPPLDGVPVLGLFGADFMANYDVDLDLPHRRFRMYRLQSCGSNLEPLEQPAFSVPFRLRDTKVLLDVKLNGKPETAILDSGASGTLIPIDMAREAGVGRHEMAGDRVIRTRGIDDNAMKTRVHRFGSLEIGAETMRNFRFGVADDTVDEMILGDDFLRHNRVWISYPLRRLYIQPFGASTVP